MAAGKRCRQLPRPWRGRKGHPQARQCSLCCVRIRRGSHCPQSNGHPDSGHSHRLFPPPPSRARRVKGRCPQKAWSPSKRRLPPATWPPAPKSLLTTPMCTSGTLTPPLELESSARLGSFWESSQPALSVWWPCSASCRPRTECRSQSSGLARWKAQLFVRQVGKSTSAVGTGRPTAPMEGSRSALDKDIAH